MTDLTCYRCKQPLDGTKCGCRDGITLIHGDSRDVLPALPEGCCSLVVTDPPYGIGFMGKDFDTFKPEYIESRKRSSSPEYAHQTHPKGEWGEDRPAWASARYDRSLSGNHAFQAWCHEMFSAVLRVCKPGTMLASFGGTRTHHRLTCAIEDAGWEIRDCMMWLFSSGFPKSLDVSKAIDKAAGVERTERTGVKAGHENFVGRDNMKSLREGTMSQEGGFARPWMHDPEQVEAAHWDTAPATDAAKTWEGYGTALSPSYEPIVLAMKPLDSTFAGNALEHGVSGINVDAGRIGTGGGCKSQEAYTGGDNLTCYGKGLNDQRSPQQDNLGRWPKNAVFSHHPACVAVGSRKVKGSHGTTGHWGSGNPKGARTYGEYGATTPEPGYTDADGLETVEAYHCAAGCPCGHVWPTESLQPCPECGCRKTAWCCPVAMLGEQSGESGGGKARTTTRERNKGWCNSSPGGGVAALDNYGDSGNASRFFKCFPPEVRFAYIPKASGRDRGNLPAEDLPLFGEGVPEFRNTHPTCKPLGIMLYLLGLLYPPGPDALCLDPFAGSGTTLVAAKQMGRRCLGIESEEEYCRIAVQRLEVGR